MNSSAYIVMHTFRPSSLAAEEDIMYTPLAAYTREDVAASVADELQDKVGDVYNHYSYKAILLDSLQFPVEWSKMLAH